MKANDRILDENGEWIAFPEHLRDRAVRQGNACPLPPDPAPEPNILHGQGGKKELERSFEKAKKLQEKFKSKS